MTGTIASDGTTTLEVYYDRNSYTVTFNADGGTPTPAPQNIRYEGSITLPTEPTKEHYTFDGWFDANGNEYDGTTPILEGVELKAKWVANSYTVTFDANGGTPVPAAQTVTYGEKAECPNPPTKSGFTFGGWTLNGIAYDFNAPVEGDITLVATWDPIPVGSAQYTIKYYKQNILDNGYTEVVADIVVSSGVVGSTITATDKAYEGFTLNAASSTMTGTIASDGTTTLEVYYDRNSYTVTFNADGGTPTPAPQSIRYEGSITLPTEPTKDHYTFDGWFDANGNEYDDTTPILEGVELKAKWTKTEGKYKVEYYKQNLLDDNYTLVNADTFEAWALVGSTVTATDVAYPNYTKNTGLSVMSGVVASDDSLVLKVYYDLEKHTVAFDANGGTPTPQIQDVKHGGKAQCPNPPTKSGFTFGGWTLNGIAYDFNAPVEGDITLVATWDPIPVGSAQYTIKYYKQNILDNNYTEVVADIVVSSGVVGSTITATDKAYEGFTLNAASSTMTGTIASDGTTTLEVYYDRNSYTVTFNADGGTPTPAPQSIRYEGSITLPTEPTKEHYTFDGWFDANGNEYDDTTPILEGVELKAKWVANSYTVTFDANGGTPVPAPQTVTYGEKAECPNPPTKSGFTFGGWTLNGIAYDFNAPVEGDITLVAVWNNIPANNAQYTVKYYKQKTDLTGYEEVVADRFTGTDEIGKLVTAVEKTYEGFIFNATLSTQSGNVLSDNSLVLEMYYDIETVNVTFIDNGWEVKTEEVAKGYALIEGKMPTDAEASYSTVGFVKDTAISSLYQVPYEHVINFKWWYNKGTDSNPDWQLFIPEIKDGEGNVIQVGTKVTKDTDVYLASQEFALRGYLNKYDRQFPFATYYENDTRFLDTLKDIIYKGGPLNAVKTVGLDDEGLEKLRKFKVIDDDNNVLMQSFLLRYSMVIDDMAKFVRDAAEDMFKTSSKLNSSLPEFIALELNGTHLEKAKLDEMLIGLIHYVGIDTVKQELENSGITVNATITEEELLAVVYANSSNQTMLEAISVHFTDYLSTHNDYRKYVVDQIIDKQYGETFKTLVHQLENDERFDVTADTSFIIDGLLNKLKSFDYDTMKAKLPEKFEKIFLIYPEEKVIEIYGGAFDRVKQEAEDALYDLENGIATEIDCATGVEFIANPVVDVYIPLYDNLTDLLEDKAGSKYYYNENVYLKELIKLFEVSNWFDQSSTSETGYKLRTTDDYYQNIVKASILGDDAFVWYHDNLDMDKVNKLADNYQELVLKYVNIAVDMVEAYIEDGELPDKVDKDVVRKLEAKVLELLDSKFPGLLDKAINWYKGSQFNKDYTGEDYDKVKKAVNYIINNANITTNEVFDDILAEKFEDKEIATDKYRQEFRNNWIQVERTLFK